MMKICNLRVLAALLLLVGAACSEQQQDPGEVAQPLPVSAVEEVPKVPDTQWAQHGNDTKEQRYSDLQQINSRNVHQLGLAWSFDLYTRRGVESTPLMIDGVLYVTGSWSMVYALDARSGELKWFYDPQVDRSFLAKGCCGAVRICSALPCSTSN